MLDDLVNYLRGISAKDVVASIATALITLAGTIYVTNQKTRATRDQHEIDAGAQARLADHNYNMAQTQDLTMRFRALMDGYEVHIRDLTAENASMRTVIKELQDRLESRNA